MSGYQIKYTTYRLNYGSDEVMENAGGMPSTGKEEVSLTVTENGTYTPDEGKVFNSVDVNIFSNKLYAWRRDGYSMWCYTLTDKPALNSFAFGSHGGSANYDKLYKHDISSFDTDYSYIKLNGFGQNWNRDSSNDISIN